MKNTTSETKISEAFNRFKICDKPNIFNEIDSLTHAECNRFHACKSENEDAKLLASFFPEPNPVRIFEFDQNNRLERYSDGSLHELSSRDGSAWSDFRDFRSERLPNEILTSGLRDFFGEDEPEDSSDFRITIVRYFFGPTASEEFALDFVGQFPLSFSTRTDAQAWINAQENQIYRLEHNESSRPMYVITPV